MIFGLFIKMKLWCQKKKNKIISDYLHCEIYDNISIK
jgi:hypothetical protein